MKFRKTIDSKILLYRIDVYCATMADFWNEKNDPMYFESKQGIYTIAGIMQDFMGHNYSSIIKYAIDKLNEYCVSSDSIKNYTTDEAEKELLQQ